MNEQRSVFAVPPSTRTADGRIRQVGFELEFSGVDIEAVAAATHAALGGELHQRSAAEYSLEAPQLGRFNIELDWDYLKRKAALAEEHGDDGDRERVGLLSKAANLIVPLEVVCPPIPITELSRLDVLVECLREAGAVGTDESPMAAYGVHINPEIPRLDARTISAYLRAFALLQWWLAAAHDVDIARRISPYVDFYPEEYVKDLAVEPPARLDDIFSGYLSHNPTRNRALDLLPLLAEIDPERVRRTVADNKVNARPTFHYRLPNCDIGHEDWSLAEGWNVWVVVERLSDNATRLDELSKAFHEHFRPLLGLDRQRWIEYVDQWLKDRELA